MANLATERCPDAISQPPTARVFFALWPPAGLAAQLGDIAREAAATFGGRATRPETIHLTLTFLGDVPESRLPALTAAASQVSADAFALNIDRLGFWSHNHLLWAGCTAPGAELAMLSARLNEALGAAGFKAARAAEHFLPHVTLVRRIPAAGPPPALGALSPIVPLNWPCKHFSLVRSTLTGSGSNYQVLAEFLLRGANGG